MSSLREDAHSIWRAGVSAVDSSSAVSEQISCDGKQLCIAGTNFALKDLQRIEVLGAGKAGAGMAHGLESALLKWIPPEKLTGWVNVPADCIRPLRRIHLHAARPAGVNEPTPQGIEGTNEILRRLRDLASRDICIVLLSGGASALLCSPVSGVSLADKLAVTRALSASGAPIQELNLVRTQLSQVKGGRLASACQANTLISLIISDVIGDPLDVIGSGPTVKMQSRSKHALEILKQRNLLNSIPESVIRHLSASCEETETQSEMMIASRIQNVIVASNTIALTAAANKAMSLGYSVESLGSSNAGDAADEGRSLMQKLLSARASNCGEDQTPLCILSGGEPTVNLTQTSLSGMNDVTSSDRMLRSKGGRNQELVLAAIASHPDDSDWRGLAMLSGGTDGEDGPTDAAGAFADERLVQQVRERQLDPTSFLRRHDSYHFFDAAGALLQTGPTHTNVMDLRVGLVGKAD